PERPASVHTNALRVVTTIQDKSGVNQAPDVVGLALEPLFTTDNAPVAAMPQPFANVTITDADSAYVVATITLDPTQGAFMPDRSSGFRHLGNGVYEMVGAVGDVQEALRSLRFDAADRAKHAAGSLDAVTLTLTVQDLEGAQAAPATVQVHSTAANRAPS